MRVTKSCQIIEQFIITSSQKQLEEAEATQPLEPAEIFNYTMSNLIVTSNSHSAYRQ